MWHQVTYCFLPRLMMFLWLTLTSSVFAQVTPTDPSLTRGTAAVKAPAAQAEALYEESRALLIGASNYQAGMAKLPGVKEDIKAVYDVLVKRGFKVEVVEDPDVDRLERAYREFINRYGLNPKNRLLFYFAGHGVTLRQSYGGEMGYILPIDAPPPSRDEAAFLRRAMDMQQIEVYARRIQAKHALFIFDSCFSGSLFALRGAGTVPPSINYKTLQPVRQFITSGGSDESVPDVSVFRRQLVLGLEGESDLNRDGYVTGSELGDFLQQRVVDYTRGTQHPQYGKIRDPSLDRGDFVFMLPGASSVSATGQTRDATAPPPQDDQAYLYLNSRPESTLHIDGAPVSGFPLINHALPKGRHTVAFVLPQGQRIQQEIELAPGRTLRCVARFDRDEVQCKQDDLERGTVPDATAQSQPSRSSETLNTGMVVVLPGAEKWQAGYALAQHNRDGEGIPQWLEVTHPRFLDPFRRGLIPLIREQATNRICAAGVPRFADLSAEAAAALDLLQLERAGALLAQGWTAFSCERTIITDQQIAKLLFLSGLLQLYLGEEDRGFFAEALAIFPGLPFPWEYPKRFQAAFTKARAGGGQERVKLNPLQGDLANLELRLDGVLLSSPPTSLAAGRHFLQLVTRDGRVIAGTTLNLLPVPSGEAVDWPPPQMRAPSTQAAQDALEQIAITDNMDADTLISLDWMLAESRRPWLVVVIPDTGERPGVALWVSQKGEHLQYKLSQTDGRWVAGTIALGSLTVATSLVYAYTYVRAESLELSPQDINDYRWTSGVALGTATLALVGTLLSTSYTIKFPPQLYRSSAEMQPKHSPKLPPELQPELTLSAGPGRFELRLAGTW